jgi:hypothetical protein
MCRFVGREIRGDPLVDQWGRHGRGRLREELVRRGCPAQQRLDFTAQIVIPAAGVVEEDVALVRGLLERRVVNPLDLAPAFGIHRSIAVGRILHK